MRHFHILTHVINKIANFIGVGRARTVLRSRHQDGRHVIPEDLRPVVQATVENAEVIVLVGHTERVTTHRRKHSEVQGRVNKLQELWPPHLIVLTTPLLVIVVDVVSDVVVLQQWLLLLSSSPSCKHQQQQHQH